MNNMKKLGPSKKTALTWSSASRSKKEKEKRKLLRGKNVKK